MKRTLLYIIVLAVALAVPVERLDIGELRPVELVSLYREGNVICVETDTGDIGKGATLVDAVKDLEDTAEGAIYLDTAEYLVVSQDARNLLNGMGEFLKPSVRVCVTKAEIDPAQSAAYLAAHPPGTQLKWEGEPDELTVEEGRLKILKK